MRRRESVGRVVKQFSVRCAVSEQYRWTNEGRAREQSRSWSAAGPWRSSPSIWIYVEFTRQPSSAALRLHQLLPLSKQECEQTYLHPVHPLDLVLQHLVHQPMLLDR